MKRLKSSMATALVVMILAYPLKAQLSNSSAQKMFRLFEDNDFINLRGKGTDEAYTNGVRFDIFYRKNAVSGLFLDKWMPKAGDKAANTYGWGIMQLMYTPGNISTPEPDPADFPYAGALFFIRSLHSSDPVKKYSINSELEMGITGPLSFAEEAQIAVHKLVNYKRPMGWDHQLPTDVVLNVNFTAEKMIFQSNHWFEFIGGSQVMAGTMINGLTAYSLIRIGKMGPYFDGLIDRYLDFQKSTAGRGQKWQAFLIMKPGIAWVHRNSLISGGYFNGERDRQIRKARMNSDPVIAIPHRHILRFDYGFSLTRSHITLAVTQKVESASIYGASNHEIGNISIYIIW